MTTEEVREAVGLSRTSIWRLEREGKFPKRRQVSAQRVGWITSEIMDWVEATPLAEPDPHMAEQPEGSEER